MDFGYTLSGFVVGTIVGLTGVGGGSLMTPLLVLLFGVHPATAVGTDLLYAAITKGAGTLVHGSKGTVDWTIVKRLAWGSLPAAAVTLLFVAQFDLRGSGVTKTISVALGFALLLTAAALLLRSQFQKLAHVTEHAAWRTHIAPITVAVGALLGVLVSISSVGAGALGVTALLFLYPALKTVRIVGADIAHAVPLTLIAGLGHWWLGSVDWVLLGSLLLGSIPGITLGSSVAAKVPERVLRPMLATLLVIIGGKLITH
jgi:hypothetical protein